MSGSGSASDSRPNMSGSSSASGSRQDMSGSKEATMTIPTDHGGLEVLTFHEALSLLASVPIGRVAFVDNGEPVVLPVNHAMDGKAIVFRTSYGSKLDAAWWQMPVAFEVDSYDEASRTGWSVLVKGYADLVVDDDEIDRLDTLDLRPWAYDVDRSTHWVRIHPSEVSGRRIVRLE
jgi:uncharacterized protein